MEAVILVKLFQRLQNLAKPIPYIPEEIQVMEAFMENPGLLHIGEKILNYLDFKTQTTCRLVGISWNLILEKQASGSEENLDFLLITTKINRNTNLSNKAKWMSFLVTKMKVQVKAEKNLWIFRYLQTLLFGVCGREHTVSI